MHKKYKDNNLGVFYWLSVIRLLAILLIVRDFGQFFGKIDSNFD